MPGIRALFVYVHQFFSLSFLSNLIFLLYPPSASSSVLPGPPFSRWSFARCHVLFGCCTLYTEHQISEFLQICKLKLKVFSKNIFAQIDVREQWVLFHSMLTTVCAIPMAPFKGNINHPGGKLTKHRHRTALISALKRMVTGSSSSTSSGECTAKNNPFPTPPPI